MMLVLAACGETRNTNTADSADPAATAAVADPIMTDAQLARRSNTDGFRPADEPFQALVPPGMPDPLRDGAPPTVVARMASALTKDVFAGCNRAIGYSFGWAARLPENLALPANARVAEAAGSDSAGCTLRLIAYDTEAAPDAIADTYRRTAKSAGMRLSEAREGEATVLTASGAPGAFVAAVYPAKGGGSAVDLMSNRGR